MFKTSITIRKEKEFHTTIKSVLTIDEVKKVVNEVTNEIDDNNYEKIIFDVEKIKG